jgi:hypothetical protein
MKQVHDFNGGIGANGLFWMVQVPDDAVKIDDDAGTLTISLTNVAIVDQYTFPNAGGINLGNSGVPATVSFNVTFTKTGTPRTVSPTSSDPLSPFNWAGEMWKATNSGSFSVAYTDGSFSAQGTFSSAGNFGEMGTERNGSFVRHEDREEGALAGGAASALAAQVPASAAASPWNNNAAPAADIPRFKGKVPVESLVH